MTTIGLKILDIFSLCLNDNRLLKSRNFTHREIRVISRLYDWEEPLPDIETVVASELKISTERVRQIGIKALKKMRGPAVSDRIANMKSIIKSYAIPTEKDDMLKTIVRLCLFEMSELPTMKMVKILVCLCSPFNAKLGEMMEYCKSHKDLLKREFRERQQLERKSFRENKRFVDFLNSHVVWFDKVKICKIEELEGQEPKRTVKADPRYQSGFFYSHKTKRNIQYESGVELGFIKKLESADNVLYYFEQPITISYNRNQKKDFYTPDFVILLDNGGCFFVETKGNLDAIMDARLHRGIEQLIYYCRKNGFGILLSCGLQSFDPLCNYPINTTLEKIIQDKLNQRGGRTIFLNEFKEILKVTGAKKTAALALILKNNWGYYPFPFKLTPSNPYKLFRETLISRFLK